MIGASKILTVSYGTFSCTLEGFDDPFNTMKAIAEYFRDLAAEDRYFGAEPPTPDAAMLHRIAEREVQRRVEARVQDNGVILRAGEAMPAVAERAAPAPTEPAPVAAIAQPEPAVAPVVVDLDSVMGGDAPRAIAPALNPMPEGVAARLAKIRAAVALAEPEVTSPAAATLSDFTEDQHADEAFAPFTDDATVMPDDLDAAAGIDADAAMIAGLSADEDAAVEEAEVEETVLAEEIAVPSVADDADEATDSLIADLAALDATGPSDETADMDAADEMLADLAALDAPVVDAAMADDEAEDDDLADDADTTMLSNIMADADPDDIEVVTDADMIAAAAPQEALIDPEEDEAAEAWPDAAEMPADVMIEDDAAVEELVAEEVTAEVVPAPEMADPADIDPPAADVAPAAVEPAVLDKAMRARARVIRVRRSAEIAIERPAAAEGSSLPDTAEADLQRELAALEADNAAQESAAQDADLQRQLANVFSGTPEPVASAADADADLRRQLSGLAADGTAMPDSAREPGVEEDAVRRLMDQTQSEMAVPENRRRLSSIAHLKAAVAATIAERFGSKLKPVEEVEATRTEPYRNDLAQAVRPARPTGAGGQGDRPAPLVLVSEQRIDRPAPAAPAGVVTPVRPRRVTAQPAALRPVFEDDAEDDTDLDADATIFGDAKGFAEFADRVGAHGLPDLLEAAAAYAAAVEGVDSFTRPQLLRQIASVSGTDVSREDELRSFGALLRDGRIVKVKRGQFALADASPLLIEARKMAG